MGERADQPLIPASCEEGTRVRMRELKEFPWPGREATKPEDDVELVLLEKRHKVIFADPSLG